MEELLLDAGSMAAIAAVALILVVCLGRVQRWRSLRRRQFKLSAAFYRARSFRTQGVSLISNGLES